jgi:hypothetical protein
MPPNMSNLYGNNSINSSTLAAASNVASQQYIIPSNLKPHSIQTPSASVPSSAHKNPTSTSANGSGGGGGGGGAQKREATSGGGNPSQAKVPKIMPTTAVAAAQSVAAAAVVEKKITKKDSWDKNKKKSKLIRAAAGETWEDESLLEWDPGE